MLDLSKGVSHSVIEDSHDVFVIQHRSSVISFELIGNHEVGSDFSILNIVFHEVFDAFSGIVDVRRLVCKQALHHLGAEVESFPNPGLE